MTTWFKTEFGLSGLLADASAKTTVLLLVASLVALAARRRSAAVRHCIWAIALCASIVVPVLSCLVPGLRLPVFSAREQPVTTGATTLPAERLLPAPTRRVRDTAPEQLTPQAPYRRMPEPIYTVRPSGQPLIVNFVEPKPVQPDWDVAAWSWLMSGGLLAIWIAGGLAVALPVLCGLLRNEWLRCRSQRINCPDWHALCASLCRRLAISRSVEMLQNGNTSIPLTWGIVRPVILLPHEAANWPDRKRRTVLLHELAHVKRFDAGVQLAGRLAAAMYWFNPLFWYALHRLRTECEHACDDCVVREGERASDYASELLDLARSARGSRFAMNIAIARTNALENRLRSLFDDTRSHLPLDRRSSRLLAAGAFVFALGLALIHPGYSANGPNVQAPAASAVSAVEPQRAQSGEPSPKGTGRITGRVVLADGRAPVTAAEVILLLPPPKGQNVYIGKVPLRRTMADAQGMFSFDALIPGRYRVWANAQKMTSRPRQSRGEVVVLADSGDATKSVELKLKPAVTVKIRVKDKATGRPIGNATIQPEWSDFVDDFTTDSKGEVQAGPFTAERWLLEAWADGFARESRWLNLENSADAETEFRLEPGGDLEGVVRDPAGKPVADVGLSVSADGAHRQFAYTQSGPDGRYRLGNMPLNVSLRISESAQPDYARDQIETRVSSRKQQLDLTLRLRPHGGSVTGLVLDTRDRPIAGASLVNPSDSSDVHLDTTTGPQGRFLLVNLHPSVFGKLVIVRAKGFAPQRVLVEPGPADKPAELTIRLEPGHRIRGRVTDQKGTPLDGVQVYYGGAHHAEQGGGQTTTDAQGYFEFDSLPASTLFCFSKQAYSPIENHALTLDTDAVATVAMASPGLITGQVVDAGTGKPVRAFNVQITFSPQRKAGEPSSGYRAELSDPGQTFQSDLGRFQIGELLVGMPLQVTVNAQGYERRVNERVVVAPAGLAQPEVFRLEKVDPANFQNYRGRLLDAHDKPVAGAQVRLFAARNRRADQRTTFPFNWTMIHSGQLASQAEIVRFLETTTDSKGFFVFTDIPRGPEVELAWWGKGIANGRYEHFERVEDRQGWIDIKLAAPARITGTVDRKAYPKAARLQLVSMNGLLDYSDIELKADQTEFAYDDLPPGQFTVTLGTAFEEVPGRPGALTNKNLAFKNFVVEEGRIVKVEFKK
jgi:beta-lactamase regulating signal transducer with metallopeptidase domain